MSAPLAAVIYARVSTRRQAEDGLPIESQLDRCRQRAEQLGATVVREFVDHGISARTDDRAAFLDAIDWCEVHQPALFVTWSTSRFSRNKLDAAHHKRRLDRSGTRLVYVSLDLDRDTDAGFLTESVLEVLDEFVSRQVSADTRRSMLRNAEAGHWNGGHPPLGYVARPAEDDPRRKRLVIVHEEAELARRIVSLRLSGLGGRAIAGELNAEGVTNRGRRWNKATITALLRNETLAGAQAYGKKDRATGTRRPRETWMIARSHEPIIDSATWARLQSMLDDATSAPGTGSPLSRWLFTGLLTCGACGASMQIETAKGRSRRYSYYNCRAWQKHGACESRRLPADQVDAVLLAAVLDAILTPANLAAVLTEMNRACGAWGAEQVQRRRTLARRIEEATRRQSNLVDTLEDLGRQASSPAYLVRRIGELDEQMERLRAELREAEEEPPPALDLGPGDLAALAASLRDILESADPARVRNFLSGLVARILIEDEQARIVYRPEVLLAAGDRQRDRRFPASTVWLPGRSMLGTAQVVVRWPARLRRGWRSRLERRSSG